MIQEFVIPIYNATVKFVFQDDIDDAMANHCDDIIENEEALTIWWSDKHYYVIGIRTDIFKQQTVTHECVHLAHRIMSNVGIPASLTTDEAEAYLAGYLAGKIVDLATEEMDKQFSEHRYMKNFMI